MAIAIAPKGPFALAASSRFLEEFTPAAHGRALKGHVHLAFPNERTWAAAGVCVRQSAKRVTADVFGRVDEGDVRDQIARIFSLDVDASGLGAVAARDPAAGRLIRRYPGLRPVLFWSPYEAAAWTIIGQRIRMTQAATMKQRLAAEFGETVEVHGDRLHAFPGPRALLKISRAASLGEGKVARLHALAEAALEGRLDAEWLRSVGPDLALHELKRLPGIGDFSAELVLVRGAGEPDYFPRHEGRLHRAMAAEYQVGEAASVEELAAIAESWRPYRSWVSLLFRAGDGEPPA
jgi:DNA-3-methyladenine glycosylase II